MTAFYCTTCLRDLDRPYRRIVDGAVVEGCVSAAHDDHADAWHQRPESAAVRGLTRLWADVGMRPRKEPQP